MSEASPAAAKADVSVGWMVCGILFIALWIIAHIVWAGLAFMADVMANDSGKADPDKHMMLIFGMMGGQVLCGAAGVPAGLAFFWRSRRKLLLWLFAVLFVWVRCPGRCFLFFFLLDDMNKSFIFSLLLTGTLLTAAEPQTLFFAQENAKEYTRISLTIEGDQVTGTQNWLPKQPDGHGAHGTISGTINGDIIRVLYEFTIEGSEQSEDEVLKLDGDKLYIGEGQLLADPKNDAHLKLQDPSKVVFKKPLTKIPVFEPKAGSSGTQSHHGCDARARERGGRAGSCFHRQCAHQRLMGTLQRSCGCQGRQTEE